MERTVAFIGMRVPSATTDQFSAIRVLGDREPKDRMHVTLAYLGKNVPISNVLKSVAVCLALGAEFPPLDLTAAMVMCFPPDPEGRTPVIARLVTPALLTMRAALVQRLEQAKVDYSKRHPQYKPHVTLAYAQNAQKPMVISPIRWNSNSITVWGGDNEDEIFSAEIQMRGQGL